MIRGYIKQLVDYLEKNLSKGYPAESLKWALINQGHSRSEISRAMKLANEELAKKAPKLKEKPVIKVEREPIFKEVVSKAKSKTIWQKLGEFFS